MKTQEAIRILETYRGLKFLRREGKTYVFDGVACKNNPQGTGKVVNDLWELRFYAGNIAHNKGLKA